MRRPAALALLVPTLAAVLLCDGATSPGTAALDSQLGAGGGHIIAVRPGSAARWDRYAAEGLLDNRPQVVRRLPGVVGADVPAEAISLRARAELSHGRETHEGVATLGALGCYASHLKAWRAVVQSGVARALIFEEDAVLTGEGVARASALGGLLADYVDTAGTGSTLQDGFDVALLGYIRLRGAVDGAAADGGQGWLRLRGAFWGTHAYLITRRGASKLIAQVRVHAELNSYGGSHLCTPPGVSTAPIAPAASTLQRPSQRTRERRGQRLKT